MSGWITTFTGKQFFFDEPTPAMVCIEDIAHALSNICHFGGHTREFFSVAQHSVLVSRVCNSDSIDLQRWALMHDAAEAYLGDVTRPLKTLLPDYKILEARVLKVIARAFDLNGFEPPSSIKVCDDQILKVEATLYMTNSHLHDGRGNLVDIPDLTSAQFLAPYWTRACAPLDAERMFLRRFNTLF